ncbi:hypothetical protein [Patulibacter sp.]|uniref:hypothetical protein n=1 Tax=Patulibacter sp. TaxID=1912859 RepID=UPI00272373AA|nr:hypothetical protein [Patulibacter sp.]MDO9410111.1 hypothetical protein [Patulibacter sp.]
MPERRPSPFTSSMIAPALVGLVIGIVVGLILDGPVVALALGVALALSAVGRRWAVARLNASNQSDGRGAGRGGR